MKKNQLFKVREKRTQLKAQFDSSIMEYISGWKTHIMDGTVEFYELKAMRSSFSSCVLTKNCRLKNDND